ncbi:MAG: hypothetical protein OEM62_06035 [Acidobacteriota bacterium]|nr:hypothetical protein [Acidobacteriota bacterium]
MTAFHFVPWSMRSTRAGLLSVLALLLVTVAACGRLEDLKQRQAETTPAIESELASDAAAEAAAKAQAEEEVRARAAAEAEAAREELEAAERALIEKEARLAEKEAQLQKQQALQEEQARRQREETRMASRQAAIDEKERDLLEREQDLEAREVNLALAEDEQRDLEESSYPEQELAAEPQEGWSDEEVMDDPGFDNRDDDATVTPARTSRASLRPGKVFEVEFLETVSSRSSSVGDTFSGRLVQDLRAEDGTLVIPAGAKVIGKVTEVTPLKKVGGQASLGVEFTRIIAPTGEAVEIRASFVEMGADKRKDKKKIIGAAVAGAILGRVIGGKGGENAVLGAAVGAAAGTAVVARGEGKDAEIPAGETVALQLEEVVTVEVEMTGPVDPR